MKRQRKLVIYRDESGQWRYRVIAGNGREVAASEEGFSRRAYAIRRGIAAHPDALPFESSPSGLLAISV